MVEPISPSCPLIVSLFLLPYPFLLWNCYIICIHHELVSGFHTAASSSSRHPFGCDTHACFAFCMQLSSSLSVSSAPPPPSLSETIILLSSFLNQTRRSPLSPLSPVHPIRTPLYSGLSLTAPALSRMMQCRHTLVVSTGNL